MGDDSRFAGQLLPVNPSKARSFGHEWYLERLRGMLITTTDAGWVPGFRYSPYMVIDIESSSEPHILLFKILSDKGIVYWRGIGKNIAYTWLVPDELK